MNDTNTKSQDSFDTASLLDQHAELLRQHQAARASELVSGSDPELAALMQLAEQVRDNLVPVIPEPIFRQGLGAQLMQDASRVLGPAPLARAKHAGNRAGKAVRAFRRHPGRTLAGGGAAVALLGVTAAILVRGRSTRTAISPGS